MPKIESWTFFCMCPAFEIRLSPQDQPTETPSLMLPRQVGKKAGCNLNSESRIRFIITNSWSQAHICCCNYNERKGNTFLQGRIHEQAGQGLKSPCAPILICKCDPYLFSSSQAHPGLEPNVLSNLVRVSEQCAGGHSQMTEEESQNVSPVLQELF